jgi:endonuclease-3
LKRAPGIAPKTLARLGKQHPDGALRARLPVAVRARVLGGAERADDGRQREQGDAEALRALPDAKSPGRGEPIEVEPLVSTLGFFRMKSKSLVGLARALVEKHGGEVPQTMDELVALPGVGRKTANVVLGVLWNKPEGVVVDTHVMRLSQRLGWTKNTDPEKIEKDLCAILPRKEWDHTGHVLIFHGRRMLLRPQARLRQVQRDRRLPRRLRRRARRPQGPPRPHLTERVESGTLGHTWPLRDSSRSPGTRWSSSTSSCVWRWRSGRATSTSSRSTT